jgi:hypothetical protein
MAYKSYKSIMHDIIITYEENPDAQEGVLFRFQIWRGKKPTISD